MAPRFIASVGFRGVSVRGIRITGLLATGPMHGQRRRQKGEGDTGWDTALSLSLALAAYRRHPGTNGTGYTSLVHELFFFFLCVPAAPLLEQAGNC